jgi:hypothetical protein
MLFSLNQPLTSPPIWRRRQRNQRVDQPVDAVRPRANKRTSGSWRGTALRRKTDTKPRRTHRQRRQLYRTYLVISSTRPSGGVFGFQSYSSTLLVRDNLGQPGVALRKLRAPGRGATAPAVDRRSRRGRSQSHRIWAGHSLRGLNSLLCWIRVFFYSTEDIQSSL